jgi:tryptophan synthase alpha chain
VIDRIAEALQKKKGLKIMTHVVAGFPDLQTSLDIVEAMAAGGADLIEVQLPFSDPAADGPAITKANHRALEKGVRTEDGFTMINRLGKILGVPLLLMTYANIAFRMGWQRFAVRVAGAGAAGMIIPDLPFDTQEGREAVAELSRRSVPLIPVLSPGMSELRLKEALRRASGFAYLTLRVGTTGTVGPTDPNGLAFITRVREATTLPLAAGFGISSPEQVEALQGLADIAVIGSHLIRIYETEGLAGIKGFLGALPRG